MEPMTLGELLGATFRFIKKHFLALALITFALEGPYYLFDLIGSAFATQSDLTKNIITSFTDYFTGRTGKLSFDFHWSLQQCLFFFLSSLCYIFLTPMAFASIVALLKKDEKNQTATAQRAMTFAFSRYWPLIGSNVVYAFIFYGLLVLAGLLIFWVSLAVGPITFILFLVVAAFLIFLDTRWSFFAPAVLFGEAVPGLKKSWQLTKDHFWRLFLWFIVLNIIATIIESILNFLFGLLFEAELVREALKDIIALFVHFIPNVSIAFMYFDLLARNGEAVN